jgi:hypothetical protein
MQACSSLLAGAQCPATPKDKNHTPKSNWPGIYGNTEQLDDRAILDCPVAHNHDNTAADHIAFVLLVKFLAEITQQEGSKHAQKNKHETSGSFHGLGIVSSVLDKQQQ